MDHAFRCCRPDQVEVIAGEWDTLILSAYEQCTAASATADPLLVRRLRLPTKHFGGGIRSRVWLRHAAFVASTCGVLARLLDTADGAIGFYPEAAAWLGDGAFDRSNPRPYETLHAAGGSLSDALKASWETMQLEAGVQPGDEDVSGRGHLLQACTGTPLGHCGDARGYQKRLTMQLQAAELDSLTAAFDILDVKDRRRVAWRSMTKDSTRWATSFPNTAGALCNRTFTFTVAAYFGVKQPALAPYVGRRMTTTAGGIIDEFGDVLAGRSHPGGGWYRGHNANVHVLLDWMHDAGLSARAEVAGILTAGLPPAARAQAAAELRSTGRSWSQIIPDIVVTIDGRDRCFDMKVVHYGKSRYGATWKAAPTQADAVNRRAAQVASEYLNHARKLDAAYAQTPAGTIGPVERALADLGGAIGLCYGAFGEASRTVADLHGAIAAAMAHSHWRELGYCSFAHAKGCIRADLGAECALTHAREKAELVFSNLRHVHGAGSWVDGTAGYHRARRAAYSRAYRAGGGGAHEGRHFRSSRRSKRS